MVGMARVIRPWQIFVVAAAGWISRHQDAVIEYLREENRVLGRRLRLTDAQRRRLAAKGKALGYRMLSEVATIVTPDTILLGGPCVDVVRFPPPTRSVSTPRPFSGCGGRLFPVKTSRKALV
jgi:hypothetical protein